MVAFAQREEVCLTQALVRLESSNPGTYEGVVAEFVLHWLRDNTPAEVFVEQVAEGRNNVVARLRGESREHSLVYICHMDTVPIGEGWTRDPLAGEIEGDRLYGRGFLRHEGRAGGSLAGLPQCGLPETALEIRFSHDRHHG